MLNSSLLQNAILSVLNQSTTDDYAGSTLNIPLYEINIPFGRLTTRNNTPQQGLTQSQINSTCRFTQFSNIISPLNQECPISQELFQEQDDVIQIRSCRHIFHQESLLEWFRVGHGCPICRNDLRIPRRQTNQTNQTDNSNSNIQNVQNNVEDVTNTNANTDTDTDTITTTTTSASANSNTDTYSDISMNISSFLSTLDPSIFNNNNNNNNNTATLPIQDILTTARTLFQNIPPD